MIGVKWIGRFSLMATILVSMGCQKKIEIDKSGASSASFEFHNIRFKSGRPRAADSLSDALMDGDQMRKLRNNADVLKEISTFQVEIRGAADNVECRDVDCYDLSTRRARMVYDWLRGHGVSIESIYAFRGFATENPISGNGNEEERQRSRRVEFGVIRTRYGREASLIDNVAENPSAKNSNE